MSASNKKNKSKQTTISKQTPSNDFQQPVEKVPTGFWQNTRLQMYIIAAVGFLLYANTLANDFCQDDAIVITDNMFTTQGVSGISGILQCDTFYGFFKEAGKSQLVAGGRYRPFSLILFAFEYQIFGKNAFVFHLVNILLFAGLCVMLYSLFQKLFSYNLSAVGGNNYSRLTTDLRPLTTKRIPTTNTIAFFAALLFAVHPIHTEVVANIKGADEILALLLSVCATLFSLKAFTSKKIPDYLIAGALFFLALLSKENAITFLFIVPLIFSFFITTDVWTAVKQSIPYWVASLIFLSIRSAVIGTQFGGEQLELMNNPFLKFVNGAYIPFDVSERFATIFYTLGKYILLLVFPQPLTHDYYPRHIGIMTFSDVGVLLSIILYAALFVIMIKGWKKRSIFSFSIAYFFITLGIVSNIIFPVGTNMAERFVFMPSVGFCLALSYWLIAVSPKLISKSYLQIALGICILLSIKTFMRNFAWKDNYTLFTTDISVSENSAKLQCSVGGETLEKMRNEPNENIRTAGIRDAIGHLKKSLDIHPTYKNPPLLLGNAYYYLNNPDSAIYWYKEALRFDPNFKDARQNLSLAYREAGKNAGQQQNLQKSITLLNQSLSLNANDGETFSYLGTAYGIAGQIPKCIESFEKALSIRYNKNDADNLITAYKQSGNLEKARELELKNK